MEERPLDDKADEGFSRYAFENAKSFLEMLQFTMTYGNTLSPRGMLIKEVEDGMLGISPYYPFMSFNARKYDVNYFKAEMRWKLGANRYDSSIMQHAKMWESVRNDDGSFNSNYGQFWFGKQQGLFTVVQELIRDKDSRRAVIPMLSAEHMGPETRDTVCTEAVGFRIRNGRLNMSVHMRSSDQIFGLGTDIPTFCFLYRLAFALLKDVYVGLEIGDVQILAMSSHIYQRHFAMVQRIIAEGDDGYKVVEMPWCSSSAEAMKIIASRGKNVIEIESDEDEPLLAWIMQDE